MRIRLRNPETHEIIFDGDPNENTKDFRDAQRLFPNAVLEEFRPPARPQPRREAVYVGAGIWIGIGIVLAALVAGLSVRLFIWAAGL